MPRPPRPIPAPSRRVVTAANERAVTTGLLTNAWLRVRDFAGMAEGASYLWPRWLVLRAVGLVYIFVFWGILREAPSLVGPQGLAPLAGFFEQLRQSTPQALEAFFKAPGLFWINASGGMMSVVAWAGLFSSAALVLNLWPRMALLGCWVTFLSFVTSFQVFSQTQVDQLMLETAILCLPFAPAGFRPGLGNQLAPRPIAVLMLRLFLLRIMLEAGLMKVFTGDARWRELTAMDVLYETTPFPTILGYLDHQLPHFWHAGEAVLTFLAEIVAPVIAVFGGRRWRWIAFGLWTVLQAGIQLTNNFGWLNTTSIALGLILLDDQMIASAARCLRLRGMAVWLAGKSAMSSRPAARGWRLQGLRVALWGQLYFALYIFAVNCGGFPANDIFHRPLRAAFGGFQSANSYSLYAALLPFRTLLEFEGSNDGGQTWRPYDFRYQAQREGQIPSFIAPYYPRFEATLQSEGLNPTPSMLYQVVAGHLLARSPAVTGLFKDDPFKDRPARMLRVLSYRLSFTDFATYRKHGHFWKKEVNGLYQPLLYINEAGQVAAVEFELEELGVMAEQGNPHAQTNLALLYANGEGVAKNIPEAARWLALAAGQGYAEAQFRLGYMQARGEGLPRNPVQAVAWYRKAAEQGNAGGQYLLGLSYANGEGIEKNATEAVVWYRRAAEQGNLYAQTNLGYMYAVGEGVAKDEFEALVWLNLATLSGSPEAMKNRDILERKTAHENIIHARERARVLKTEIDARLSGR